MLRFLTNTYEGVSFQKCFKTESCDSPKYEVLDIWRDLTQVYSFFLQTYKSQNKQSQFFYINKTKVKSQVTVQESEIKIFNWVTLSAIPWVSNMWTSSNLHRVVHSLYEKMCNFAHILNECKLIFPWHLKNLLVSTGKNKRN